MSEKISDYLVPSIVLLLSTNVLVLNILVMTLLKKDVSGPTSVVSASDRSVVVPTITSLYVLNPTLPPTGIVAPRVIQENRGREFYVPIGSGKVKSSQWVAIPGAEVYVDSSRYGAALDVALEVVMRLTVAQGYLRVKLVNETEGHDVWYSDVSTESDIFVRKEAKISLSKGNNLYRLYGQSSLNAEAEVMQSRIKIHAL